MCEVLIADGFDEAVIVLGRQAHLEVVVYDREKCIEILTEDMPREDAEEFFEFNVVGAYVGKSTPVFVHRCSIEEIHRQYDEQESIE